MDKESWWRLIDEKWEAILNVMWRFLPMSLPMTRQPEIAG